MVRVRAIYAFHLFREVKAGEVFEVSEDEFRRLSNIIEPVEGVNALDAKPNTNKKGGIRK